MHRWFNQRSKEAGTEEEKFEVEKARGVSAAYLTYYERDGYTPRGVEVPFTLPLVDHEKGGQLGDATYSGIIDSVVEDDSGQLWFMDHKTASNPDRSYWQELKTNAQISHYLLAAMQMELPVKGMIWDVIQKPSIKPKDLTKKAIVELEGGDYCGLPFKAGYHGEERETPQMYGQRVYAAYIAEPGKYFERRNQYRTPQQLLRYLKGLNRNAAGMEVIKAFPDHATESLGSCKSFGSLCDYHQICAEDDPEKSGYRPRPERAEGEVRTASGSLSPSRVQCFQSCQMKYRFRYVDKIEPNRPEYNANLHFGSLVHEAIENWLLGQITDHIKFPNGESA